MANIARLTDRHALWLTLIASTIMLLPALLCGFDICDTGFYMTFYDNIFSHPESVEYNFMYYLSGVAGGGVMRLFPCAQIFGMKVLGMLCLLAAVWISFKATGLYARNSTKFISLTAIVTAYAGYPLAFSADIMSTLLLISAGALLTAGTDRGNAGMAFASALILGVNTFTRVPNLLAFGLIAVIPLSGRWPARESLRLMATFVAGYVTGVLAVILFMAAAGHIDIFLTNIRTLLDLSVDTTGTHSTSKLFDVQDSYYEHIAVITCKLALVTACASAVHSLVGSKYLRVVLYLLIARYLYDIITTVPPVMVAGAIVLPGLVISALFPRRQGERILALTALGSAVIFPLGSDGAGLNTGSITYMLGASLAVEAVGRLKVRLSPSRWLSNSRVGLLLCLSASILLWEYKLVKGNLYFDNTPITGMHGRIHTDRVLLQWTSAERAEIVNRLLEKLPSYVKEGDAMMVFGSSPMINFLSGTRPAGGCSWPELLSPGNIVSRLEGEISSGTYPVIVVQRYETLGQRWGMPSARYVTGDESEVNGYFHNRDKSEALQEFLNDHQYTRVDSTTHFYIYQKSGKAPVISD